MLILRCSVIHCLKYISYRLPQPFLRLKHNSLHHNYTQSFYAVSCATPSAVGLLLTVLPGGGFLLFGRPSLACLHNTGGLPFVSQPASRLTLPTTGYLGLFAKKSTQCLSAA